VSSSSGGGVNVGDSSVSSLLFSVGDGFNTSGGFQEGVVDLTSYDGLRVSRWDVVGVAGGESSGGSGLSKSVGSSVVGSVSSADGGSSDGSSAGNSTFAGGGGEELFWESSAVNASGFSDLFSSSVVGGLMSVRDGLSINNLG